MSSEIVLSDDEAAVIVSALRIPTCWNPRLRQEALRIIARDPVYEEQLRLVTFEAATGTASLMAQTNAVCVKYGRGATVAVDLRCPKHGCPGEAHGTAVVVNEYGVRDPEPLYCTAPASTRSGTCGLRYDVARIVDVEAAAAAAPETTR